MAYSIVYHLDILTHDLPRIPKNIRATIKRAIEQRLQINPIAYSQPLRQNLRGYSKLRVGDYRIIFRIDKEEIIILKIGHRKEVYGKIFQRLKWS